MSDFMAVILIILVVAAAIFTFRMVFEVFYDYCIKDSKQREQSLRDKNFIDATMYTTVPNLIERVRDIEREVENLKKRGQK